MLYNWPFNNWGLKHPWYAHLKHSKVFMCIHQRGSKDFRMSAPFTFIEVIRFYFLIKTIGL